MTTKYHLRMYVVGETPTSIKAIEDLKKLLEEEFRSFYELEVIDVLKDPGLAEKHKILATPTLVRVLPGPIKRIIGDLSDKDKVLIGLDLH